MKIRHIRIKLIFEIYIFLNNIYNMKSCIPFHSPINDYDHPTYYYIINKPMNINNIYKKIMNYWSKREFLYDFNIILKNPHIFNKDNLRKKASIELSKNAQIFLENIEQMPWEITKIAEK
eukprot:GHVL01005680.1.p1 GENE.GHVL01005680.1~~GHVL01005680.1.p1  ORF type:complete len:120 (+),score=37.32 GHVL01005680.1:140-499(+)